MEPIITGGGVIVPPDSYLPAVKAMCERHGVLLIVDEVICGFGRTGTWFGHEQAGVRPDIVTMAKGITGAYIPLAATVVDQEIFGAFPADPADSGRLRHINTFGGHPAGCAVALETIAIMEEERLLERSATKGAELQQRLRDTLGDHPLVGDIRGRGLLVGIELVADKATRKPVDRSISGGLVAAAQKQGLLLGRNVDTAAGLDNVLALAPPLSPHRRRPRPHRRRPRRDLRRARSGGAHRMTTILAGGTVVTAESSFRADVAFDGGTITAVGVDLPRDGAEVVDVSGARLMPGFIDGHTHMDMPFGGTVTADNWDTGTAAAVAGGTTTLVDFSLQDIEGTLTGAVETWQEKASVARIDFGLHVAITNLTEDVKRELPSLPALGVATIKIFMAYKGTPLYTEDDDLFEAMQIARECGLLVLVHAENGDAIAKLQEQAIARGETEPRFHATTRPGGRRGRGDQPRDPARRGRRRAAARRPRHLPRRRSTRSGARTSAAGRCTARPARSTSSSPRRTWRSPTSRARSTSARRRCAIPPTRASCGRACRRRTCTSSARTTARSTSTARRRWAATTSRSSRTGSPAWRSARWCCGRTASRRAGSART